jgi:hypothetical protein
MDVIHTLIDMVYTLLLLYMQFFMKITMWIDVHPNILFSLTNLVKNVLNTLLVDSTYPIP